jgi:hypothetical protein
MFAKLIQLVNAHLDFLKRAFSDGGVPSSSRLLTFLHSVAAIGVLIFYVVKTHLLPDGTVLGGLGAFSTAHYLVNRATTAFGKQQPPNGPQGV